MEKRNAKFRPQFVIRKFLATIAHLNLEMLVRIPCIDTCPSLQHSDILINQVSVHMCFSWLLPICCQEVIRVALLKMLSSESKFVHFSQETTMACAAKGS
jgi:hypothetical protein